jgi:putative PEP-CTERM system histidine kinase
MLSFPRSVPRHGLDGRQGFVYKSPTLSSRVQQRSPDTLARAKQELRRLKVLLSKRLARFKYDYREQWLKLIDNLSSSTNPLPLPDRAVMALAEIIGSPGGISFVQERDYSLYVPAGSWGVAGPLTMPWQELPRDGLITYMEKSAWIVDGEEDAPAAGKQFLAEISKYVGRSVFVVPLLLHDRLFGFVLLQKPKRHYRLTYEDIDLLRTSGRQVASHLAQHYTARRLAESQQFETYGRMTAFLIHDLKNIMAQQSLVVQNAARHKHNPMFIDDAMATIEKSLERMGRALKHLRYGVVESTPQPTDLRDVALDAVERCRAFSPRPTLETADTPVIVLADGERLSFGLTNLIRNAQQAVSANGYVQVRVTREPNAALIEVIDNGPGMTDSFVNDRLFRPFDSTSPEIGMGIGAFQLRETVRSIGGTVLVKTGEGIGSSFQLRFPIIEGGERVA